MKLALASISASQTPTVFWTLLKKDLHFARPVVLFVLALLGLAAFMEVMLVVVKPGTGPRGDLFFGCCILALLLAPGLVAARTVVGESEHRGELLSALLPVSTPIRLCSKVTAAIVVLAAFAVIPITAAFTRSDPETAWGFASLFAIAGLGILWGFAANGFARDGAGVLLAFIALPLLVCGILVVIVSAARSLLETFGAEYGLAWTVESSRGSFVQIMFVLSLGLCGFWAAWRARTRVGGRYDAVKERWSALGRIVFLAATLGVLTSVATAVRALNSGKITPETVMNIGRADVLSAYSKSDSAAEQLICATAECRPELACDEKLSRARVAWGDLLVAEDGRLWESPSAKTQANSYTGRSMDGPEARLAVQRLGIQSFPERGTMSRALARLALESESMTLGQRLDIAMLAEEFGNELPLINVASHAIADQMDPCSVLLAMEALAYHAGWVYGYPRTPCECRVRAHERLRNTKPLLTALAAARDPSVLRIDLATIDRAIAVLGAPMTAYRGAREALAAQGSALDTDEQTERRHVAIVECLECEISILVDELGEPRL